MEFLTSPTSTKFRVFPDKTPEKFYEDDSEDEELLEDPKDLIKSLRQYKTHHCTKVLKTTEFTSQTIASKNGFVRTVVDCYNDHHNLIIRPDDIWAAIMTQFSFYVNANAEEFRGKFVSFEGKKDLTVTIPSCLDTAPYDLFVTEMSKEIDKNLVDPEVKDWILPNFSTTTGNDRVSVGVVFMATMKKYFNYTFCCGCGIPWITLEGSVEDWEEIHSRLSKLKSYKLERWHDMLEPILTQFVNAKKGNVDLDFWQRISDECRGGSGRSYISGWISVFCAFDKDGKWQGSETNGVGESDSDSEETMEDEEVDFDSDLEAETMADEEVDFDSGDLEAETKADGDKKKKSKWLKISNGMIPTGIVEVNVTIIDNNGTKHNSVMFAGHMAMEVLEDGVTLKPTLGWSISLKPSPEEMEKIDREEEEKRNKRYGYKR